MERDSLFPSKEMSPTELLTMCQAWFWGGGGAQEGHGVHTLEIRQTWSSPREEDWERGWGIREGRPQREHSGVPHFSPQPWHKLGSLPLTPTHNAQGHLERQPLKVHNS